MINQEQRDRLLPKAYNAAVRAGAVILQNFACDEGQLSTKVKKDLTPITVADYAAHQQIKSYLGPTHIPILSEEGREMLYEERRGWDLFWMVDPLDGTKEFLKGNGEFTVNIALMSDNVPVLSVVYVPYLDKMYVADVARGSFRKLSVKASPNSDQTIDEILSGAECLPIAAAVNSPIKIAISRSHNTPQTFEYIEKLKKLHPDAEVIEQGSSYKLCLLAEGSFDVYVRTSQTSEWDTAAGELVLTLAEGKILSLPELEQFSYNKKSIANPHFVARSKFFQTFK